MKTDSKIRKWLSWLNGPIKDHVYELLWLRYVFTEIQEIIKKNPAIQEDDYFHEWIRVTFSKTVSVCVRRQLDCKTSDISIGRLLFEIQQSPSLLSFQRFEAFYTKGQRKLTKEQWMFFNLMKRQAQSDFKQFIGKRVKNHVDPAMVSKDFVKLNTACSQIKKYVNKRVAHHNAKKFTQFPSYNELYSAIDAILEVYKKYSLLLRGKSYDIIIQPQWNWKDVFKVAWINS